MCYQAQKFLLLYCIIGLYFFLSPMKKTFKTQFSEDSSPVPNTTVNLPTNPAKPALQTTTKSGCYALKTGGNMTTTKQILKALREQGLTAKAGWPKNGTPANEWPNAQLLGGYVVNVCTVSVLGFGCYFHPDYSATQLALCERVEVVLNGLGVKFTKSLPDQYLLEVK